MIVFHTSNIPILQPDISIFRCKHFDNYDEEWLDYVSACRLGLPVEPFDIIEGGIEKVKLL